MFTGDPLSDMPLVNRQRAERLFSLTLEQFFVDPAKADANLAHLERLVNGVAMALDVREAAVRDGL
jgi:hypothetical protein